MTRNHVWILILCCLIPVAALAAVLLFGLPISSVLLFALVLLCPMSHVAMMALMARDHAAPDHSQAAHPLTSARRGGSAR